MVAAPVSVTELLASLPGAPSEADWTFTEELRAPLWQEPWRSSPTRTEPGFANLTTGLRLVVSFDDATGALETVVDDLRAFFAVGGIQVADDLPYTLELSRDPALSPEEHRVEVGPRRTVISAADPDGIRRGAAGVENALLGLASGELPLGVTTRRPWVRTRISRCFFGPINRPPRNRDELMDDVDYYPPNYLDRLAHDGINGLWLTVRLRDLVEQPWGWMVDPADAARRLAKLRRTVESCARYGIRVFVFAIEPVAFGPIPEYMVPADLLEQHPGLAGHRGPSCTMFCTSSDEGNAYLERAWRTVSDAVPGLGGVIGITLGERPTHCWSSPWMEEPNNCPRCSVRPPEEGFRDLLGAIRRGLDATNRQAEVISWLYAPYISETPSMSAAEIQDMLVRVAAATPARCTTQMNVESNGVVSDLGRDLEIFDYSLAWPGPAEVFTRSADAARTAGAGMAAKLQVGCSHEVATVPYVPVPGNLYRKYEALHDLGVSGAMQCWYFGNYPGVMNRAAADALAFEPFPASEADLLQTLAVRDWQADAPAVVAAWQMMRDAYARFPAALLYSWYGPVHNAPMWPLLPDPADEPVSPSWTTGWPPTGDRVAETFAPVYGWSEILERAREMAEGWRRGFDLLPHHRRDRARELGVAEAMALQLESGARVLAFYDARERLAAEPDPKRRAPVLALMRDLVAQERAASLRLAELADADSRLGFHSEAEAHQYHPAGLRWRADQLVAVDERLQQLWTRTDPVLWPGWLTPDPAATSADGGEVAVRNSPGTTSESASWLPVGETAAWAAWSDADALTVSVRASSSSPDEHITLWIEAARLWPVVPFTLRRDGFASTLHLMVPRSAPWSATATATTTDGDEAGWEATFRLPWGLFRVPDLANQPIRVNVLHVADGVTSAWQTPHPVRHRLAYGERDHRTLGWLLPAGSDVSSE